MAGQVGGSKGGDFRTATPAGWLRQDNDGCLLSLHVQPGARRTAVVGLHGERLKIAIATPPTDGRANAALIDFLAGRLGVPKARLALVAGATARDKRIAVHGVTAAAVVDALAAGRAP